MKECVNDKRSSVILASYAMDKVAKKICFRHKILV